MRYYTIRILAALFFMGLFGIGCIFGAEYGKFAGGMAFLILMATGIVLHIKAGKIQKEIEGKK